MEGYIFIENDFNSLPSQVFSRRYFTSFPFCGLKWFTDQPSGGNRLEHQFRKDANCGWIFGGHVNIYSVALEPSKVFRVYNSKFRTIDENSINWSESRNENVVEEILFPFIIQVKYLNNLATIRLACAQEIDRYNWVNELRECEVRQAFVQCNLESENIPSLELYENIRSFKECIVLKNLTLRSKMFSSIVNFLLNRGPYGLMLQSLCLDNVRLHDNQLKQLSTIINASIHIKQISLSDNFISDKGIILLGDSISRSKELEFLNLAGNYIGNDGVDIISQCLLQCRLLTHLNLSRNRLSSGCVRTLTLYIATHFSQLRYIDFSFNNIGDGITAIASLLMQNKPPVIQYIDIAHCGIGPQGFSELSSTIENCSSLRYLNIGGSKCDRQSLANFFSKLSKHQSYSFTAKIAASFENHIDQEHDRSNLGYQQHTTSLNSVAGVSRNSENLVRGHVTGISGRLQVDVGGLDLNSSKSIEPVLDIRALKSSLAYINERTYIKVVILRRKFLVSKLTHGKITGNNDSLHSISLLSRGMSESKRSSTPENHRKEVPQIVMTKTSMVVNSHNVNYVADSSRKHKLNEVTPDAGDLRSSTRMRLSDLDINDRNSAVNDKRSNSDSVRPRHASTPSQKHHIQNDENLVTGVDFLIYMRIFLPPFLRNEHEFLVALAGELKIDSRQLRLLSTAELSLHPSNSKKACMIVFTIDNLLESEQQCASERIVHGAYSDLDHVDFISNLMIWEPGNYDHCYKPARDVIRILQENAANSLPSFRMLGIATVYIQFLRPDFQHSLIGDDGKSRIANIAQYSIQHTGRGGRGASDFYLPPIAPDELFLSDIHSQFDIDTDDEVELMEMNYPATTIDGDNHSLSNMPSSNDSQKYSGSSFIAISDFEGSSVAGDSDQISSKLGRRSRRSSIAGSDHTFEEHALEKHLTDFTDISKRIKENRLHDLKKKQEYADINNRLIFSIRRLFVLADITSEVARFWEAAFGNKRYEEILSEGMASALDEEGIFNTFKVRKELCTAMFDRNLPQIKKFKEELRGFGSTSPASIDDPLQVPRRDKSIDLAELLYNEVVSLKHRAKQLFTVAVRPSDLGQVEEFLLLCGRIGYADSEMITAVALRQQLVEKGSAEQPLAFMGYHMDLIKKRALLSNLMISRDIDGLQQAIDDIHKTSSLTLNDNTESDYRMLNEYRTAILLLKDYRKCISTLHNIIKQKDDNGEALDDALVAAAYGNFYDEWGFREASYILTHLNHDPLRYLLSPIVAGIRRQDKQMIEQGLVNSFRAGWKHPAVNTEVVRKIVTMRDKIVEEDQLKNDIVKFALQIREGEKLSLLEVVPLVRKATIMGWKSDPSMASYIAILEKKVKKNKPFSQLEEEVQKLINAQDIPGLANFLAGRGSHRLILSAPSLPLMQEWFLKIQDVCNGNTYDGDKPLMTGTLEKPARCDSGPLRFWKKRFFILQGKNISYRTSLTGEIKGIVRVLGGSVRMMKSLETNGKPFCLELIEGIDLSRVDKDLINQSLDVIRLSKRSKTQALIKAGIRSRSAALIEKGFQDAKDLQLVLDDELISVGIDWLSHLSIINARRTLRQALIDIPTSQFEQIIERAKELNLDNYNYNPFNQNTLLGQVISMSTKGDVEQSLLRLRACVLTGNEASFRRIFAFICRHNLSKFSLAESRRISTTILEHAGRAAIRSYVDGESIPNVAKLVSHALASCRSLYVESDAMQLVRLIIILATPVTSKSRGLVGEPVLAIGSSSGDVSQYINDGERNARQMSQLSLTHLNLEDYPFLREKPISKIKRKQRFKKLLGLRRKKQLDNIQFDLDEHQHVIFKKELMYSKDPLAHSLIFLDESLSSIALEFFEMLKAIMGDQPISSLKFSKQNIILRDRIDFTIADLTSLIVSLVIAQQALRDEVLMQLCKQLTGNKDTTSRLRGWLLLTIYLHGFHPSKVLLPHLKNFLVYSIGIETLQQTKDQREYHEFLQEESLSDLNDDSDVNRKSYVKGTRNGGGVEDDKQLLAFKLLQEHKIRDHVMTTIIQLISYAIKLINKIEALNFFNQTPVSGLDTFRGCKNLPDDRSDSNDESMENLDIVTDVGSNESSPGHFGVEMPRELVAFIFARAPIVIDIVLMTGSAYRFTIRYGEVDTPYSLLLLLVERMLGGPVVVQAMASFHGLTSSDQQDNPHVWMDFVLKVFRGMAFYNILDESTGQSGETLFSTEDNSWIDGQKSDRNSDDTGTLEPRSTIDGMYDDDESHLPSPPPSVYSRTTSRILDSDVNSSQMPPSITARSSASSRRGVSHLSMLPIQPSQGSVIDWDSDVLWETITSQFKLGTPTAPYTKILLRRQLGASSELFVPLHEIFDEHDSEGDITAKLNIWMEWLTTPLPAAPLVDTDQERADSPDHYGKDSRHKDADRKDYMDLQNINKIVAQRPLPYDFLRIDLLFAEESRYVNSRLYPLSEDSLAYLVAVQLVLDWEEDIDPLLWGREGCDGVIEDAGLAIRPCMPFNPRAYLYPKPTSTTLDPAGQLQLNQASSQQLPKSSSRSRSKLFRRSIVGNVDLKLLEDASRLYVDGNVTINSDGSLGGADFDYPPDEHERDEDDTEDDDDIDDDILFNLFIDGDGSTDASVRKFRSTGDTDDNDYDDDTFGDYDLNHPDDITAFTDDDIISLSTGISATTRSSASKKDIKISILNSVEGMDSRQRAHIESKLKLWGIDNPSIVTSKSDSERLFNFVSFWLLQFHQMVYSKDIPTDSPKFRYLMKRIFLEYLMSNPFYGHHFSDAMQLSVESFTSNFTLNHNQGLPRPVVVTISSSGIQLLNPSDWSIYLSASLWDIDFVRVENNDDASSASHQQDISGSCLYLELNGWPIRLQSSAAWDQYRMINSYVIEVLGRGMYPMGTEGGNDISAQSGQGQSSSSQLLELSSEIVPQGDPKEVMKRFLANFPIVPPPPPMYLASRSLEFVDIPRSLRQRLADEKAQEVEREKYAERMAAAAVMERLESDITKGKQNAVDINGDGSDDEVDTSQVFTPKTNKPKQRKSRQTIQIAKMGSLIPMSGVGALTGDQLLAYRVNAAVVGVAPRSRYDSNDQLYTVLDPPRKVGALLQLDVETFSTKKVRSPPSLGPMLFSNELKSTPHHDQQVSQPLLVAAAWKLPGIDLAFGKNDEFVSSKGASKGIRVLFDDHPVVSDDGFAGKHEPGIPKDVLRGVLLGGKSKLPRNANESLTESFQSPSAGIAWNGMVKQFQDRFSQVLSEEFVGLKLILEHGDVVDDLDSGIAGDTAEIRHQYGGSIGIVRGRCLEIAKKLIADQTKNQFR